MRGQDLTNYRIERRAAENKLAFDQIIGDPFSKPEPTTGHYVTFKSRGIVKAMTNNFEEGAVTRNPAAPNITDFLCDVERTLELALSEAEFKKFVDTYFYEKTGKDAFTQRERGRIEQRIGQALRENSISPVSKYFTSIRRNTSHERSNPRSTADKRNQQGNSGAAQRTQGHSQG